MSDKEILIKRLETIVQQYKLDIIPSIYRILTDLVLSLNVTIEQMNEIMQGAFVIIDDDGGHFYRRWITLQTGQHKLIPDAKITKCGGFGSSHFSCQCQHRLNGGVLVTVDEKDQFQSNRNYDLLVGCTFIDPLLRIEKNKYNKPLIKSSAVTFFQFERHNLQTWGNVANHFVSDFITHNQSLKKLNVGPFGSSKFVEKNPLILVADKSELK